MSRALPSTARVLSIALAIWGAYIVAILCAIKRSPKAHASLISYQVANVSVYVHTVY